LVATSSVAHDPPEGGEGLPRSLGPPAIRIGSQGGAADYAEAVTFGDVFDANDGVFAHDGDRGLETGDGEEEAGDRRQGTEDRCRALSTDSSLMPLTMLAMEPGTAPKRTSDMSQITSDEKSNSKFEARRFKIQNREAVVRDEKSNSKNFELQFEPSRAFVLLFIKSSTLQW